MWLIRKTAHSRELERSETPGGISILTLACTLTDGTASYNRNFKSLSLTGKDKPQAGFVEQLVLHGLLLVGISSLRSWNSGSCEHHRQHSTSFPLVVFSGKSLKQQHSCFLHAGIGK